MIGQTISHYKILEKLGEGGMSQNFLQAKRADEVLRIPLERSENGSPV
jgi:hypothetical protein